MGQGMVRVFKTGAGGREQVLHIVGPGESFAEAAAIGGFPLPASAEASERPPASCCRRNVSATCWSKTRALPGRDDQPGRLGTASGRAGRRRHAPRCGRPTRSVPAGSVRVKPAADGTVKLPGLKRHVASHLNLTSETFSRTLRRLVEAGLVAEIDKSRVRLLQPKKLRQVAAGMFPKL